MPRPKINDYIFYKIVNVNGEVDLCYVGSTANWKHRASLHKSNCSNENNKEYNSKKYKTIREYGGWGEFKMVEIGRAEQLTKRQAEQKEEEYRIQLNAELNSIRCFTTEEQKKEDKKEYMKQYCIENIGRRKEYLIANGNKINEKFNCDCGGKFTFRNKTQHNKTNKHQIYIKSIQTDTHINPTPHLDTQSTL